MTRADSAWWRTADPIISVVLGRFGRLDIPVNNAGMFISKPFSDYTTDDYATVSEVNLAGLFWRPSAPSPRWSAGTAATWSMSRPPS
ncbi:MAG TPA: SDR family NAD(P)-dependent oxidoreductase, partial [Streptosporangiaceae bacterium]